MANPNEDLPNGHWNTWVRVTLHDLQRAICQLHHLYQVPDPYYAPTIDMDTLPYHIS